MSENNFTEDSNEEKLKNPEHKDSHDTGEEQLPEEDSANRFQEFFTDKVEDQKPKMTDTLLKFLALREIDEELAEIDEEKGDLPESIETMIAKQEAYEGELNGKREILVKLEEEQNLLEKADSTFEEKINKYDEQKFNVRSNKEYDEIVKTIDSLFEEVKKNETRVKEIKEVSETLRGEVEGLEGKITEQKSELGEKQTLLDELNEQYKQDEVVLKEKRHTLISGLDYYSSSLYERINNSFRGEATAIVRKGNCSGCFNSIPPQRVIEIRIAEKIFTCQSCGRILIPEEVQINN
ncbi:MAG: C4-type zinc ribbon domain-containing protein [bacterium]|nr:C4-type zinc ribbon domain-containing protein [bacterium]